MENRVWAFNKVDDEEARNLVYESVKSGKSRFGWSQLDEHNLNLKDNWTKWHSKQMFLLQINPGDWIVHINTPTWGKCIAAKVISSYDFDDGLQLGWGKDFRHFFYADQSSVIEFDRENPNIFPTRLLHNSILLQFATKSIFGEFPSSALKLDFSLNFA